MNGRLPYGVIELTNAHPSVLHIGDDDTLPMKSAIDKRSPIAENILKISMLFDLLSATYSFLLFDKLSA